MYGFLIMLIAVYQPVTLGLIGQRWFGSTWASFAKVRQSSRKG